jgi:hypothetical protein
MIARSKYHPRRSAARKQPPVATMNMLPFSARPIEVYQRPAVANAKPSVADKKNPTNTKFVRIEQIRKTNANMPSASA